MILIDDTSSIAIGVPGSWTDVNTAPNSGLPFIEAAPDLEVYINTFDVPGVTYEAAPFSADTEAEAHNFGLSSGCANEEMRPYNDGAFVGSHLVYTQCGAEGDAEFHVIAANPQNQGFTALLRIQITGPQEAPLVDTILSTVGTVAAGPAPSAPATPGAPTTTVPRPRRQPPTSRVRAPRRARCRHRPVEVPADWTTLVDGANAISIAVPSSWTASELAPMQNQDGTPQPWISATTDEALFFPPEGTPDTYSVPGVIYRAYPIEPNVANLPATLDNSYYHGLCTADPMQTYDDGAFVGYIQSFNGCGGTATRGSSSSSPTPGSERRTRWCSSSS